jgi:hypothetical protein
MSIYINYILLSARARKGMTSSGFSGFLKLHSTMLKIIAYVLLTIAYFIGAYFLEFGMLQFNLMTAPSEV